MNNDIKNRLQKEIDGILNTMDEKALYAEFEQDEIYSVKTEGKETLIHEISDERICVSPRRAYARRNPNKTEQKIKGLFTVFFKPI